MPTLGNVVINDGASTPVARTFVPSSTDTNGFQRWFEKTATKALGFWKLAQRLTTPSEGAKASSSDRVYRAVITLNTPVLEVTSPGALGYEPAPTLSYLPSVRMEFTLPERSSVQDRKHLRVLMANWLAHANAVALVDNLEPTFNG